MIQMAEQMQLLQQTLLPRAQRHQPHHKAHPPRRLRQSRARGRELEVVLEVVLELELSPQPQLRRRSPRL